MANYLSSPEQDNNPRSIENEMQEDHRKINTFLLDLHERQLNFKRDSDELKDITEAVNEMVDSIVANFGKVNKAYSISHKYLVGSMAEDTSIQEPNEYDFLAVLEHLSKPSVAEVERVHCDDRVSHPGMKHSAEHARLKIKDEFVSQMFSQYIKEGYLCGMYFVRSIYPIEESLRICQDTTIRKLKGTLSMCLPQVAWHGPANKVPMKWTPVVTDSPLLDISVDISLAVEVQGGVASVAKPEDVAVPLHYETLVLDDKFMLVNEPGTFLRTCLRLTFTNTEVKLIRMMSLNHKTCYRILKYFLAGIEVSSMEVFSSYVVKTFVLMHAEKCTDLENIFHCIRDILLNLSDSFSCFHEDDSHLKPLSHINVKTIFNRTNYVSTQLYTDTESTQFKTIISRIVSQLLSLGRIEEYSFEDCLSHMASNLKR